MGSILLTAVLSYLLGSIPFGYLLVRIFRGEDVRQSGSGNIGATNVSRKSPLLGVLTLLLDALKGTVSVAIGILLNPPAVLSIASSHVAWHRNPPLAASSLVAAGVAALFALLGHMFPVWLKFRGGKGVATGLGSFVVIAPKAVLVAAGIFLAVVLVFRYVSLGSIVAVVAFPVAAWLLHEYGDTPLALGLMSLASLLIVAKHHENIRRLLAGTENRIGSRPA
ncbi:MAG: glycerol-3-phosphate 1-O-acyltransferase PlsY [Acidobacteriia bacterium]|nr:glycerol-3-phosphate 1-O-acyltransferase PlsY [Terriglobia bacterium]